MREIFIISPALSHPRSHTSLLHFVEGFRRHHKSSDTTMHTIKFNSTKISSRSSDPIILSSRLPIRMRRAQMLRMGNYRERAPPSVKGNHVDAKFVKIRRGIFGCIYTAHPIAPDWENVKSSFELKIPRPQAGAPFQLAFSMRTRHGWRQTAISRGQDGGVTVWCASVCVFTATEDDDNCTAAVEQIINASNTEYIYREWKLFPFHFSCSFWTCSQSK